MNGKTLVLGANGSLGGLALDRAIQRFGEGAVIAGFHSSAARIKDRHPLVATRRVDIGSQQSIAEALDGVGLVISAAPQKEPLLQAACATAGINSVDVGAHYLVAREALRIESPQSFQLVCAGQAPGVTGLMAKQLHALTGQPVDVSFLLANRGRSGRAGVTDMLRIIDTSPNPPVDFHYYGTGRRRSVPAEHNELSISEGAGATMESMVAFENNILNEVILALRKVGILRALYSKRWLVGRIAQPTKETDDEAVYLSAESDGQRLDIRSESDYLAAAYSAVALAELAVDKRLTGVSVPAAQDITLDEVIARTDGVIRVVNGDRGA